MLAETVGYLGAGIATLINLFNPERIVLGGWAGLALGERWLPEIRAATAEHALRRPYSQTSIVLCELGSGRGRAGRRDPARGRSLLADGGIAYVPRRRARLTEAPAASRVLRWRSTSGWRPTGAGPDLQRRAVGRVVAGHVEALARLRVDQVVRPLLYVHCCAPLPLQSHSCTFAPLAV